MKLRIIVLAVALVVGMSGVAAAAMKPASHPLFDGDTVHEIHLTFHQADWWDQLTYNYEHYDDIPYIEAEFDWGTLHFDDIGVRFKGNSSYMSYNGLKKSFKLDIDEFTTDQTVYGLDKLNLNNCFLDPSFVREKCAYELCEAVGLPTERTNYAAVYINGTYWGLYLLIEQYDQEFIESRFGAGEEGNLWKGEPHGSLEYLGASEASYYPDYELKTNEDINDWSSLVELT
ncbi:MAG: CotH kinase family protein, partial [candidate division Zixibacteria bacterium]|nr:CotH kinase family protein [candidate division Zixibacteria bacterium]